MPKVLSDEDREILEAMGPDVDQADDEERDFFFRHRTEIAEYSKPLLKRWEAYVFRKTGSAQTSPWDCSWRSRTSSRAARSKSSSHGSSYAWMARTNRSSGTRTTASSAATYATVIAVWTGSSGSRGAAGLRDVLVTPMGRAVGRN